MGVIVALISVLSAACRGRLGVFYSARRVRVVIIILTVNYYTLTARACGLIFCWNVVGDGRLRLDSDVSVVCYRGVHTTAAVFAWALLPGFCLGFPLLLWLRLRAGHRSYPAAFVPGDVSEDAAVDRLFRARWGFSFESYRTPMWWSESCVFALSLAMSASFVLLSRHFALAHLIVTVATLTAAAVFVGSWQPFASRVVQQVAAVFICAALLATSLNYVAMRQRNSRPAVSIAIFVVIALVLVFTVLTSVLRLARPDAWSAVVNVAAEPERKPSATPGPELAASAFEPDPQPEPATEHEPAPEHEHAPEHEPTHANTPATKPNGLALLSVEGDSGVSIGRTSVPGSRSPVELLRASSPLGTRSKWKSSSGESDSGAQRPAHASTARRPIGALQSAESFAPPSPDSDWPDSESRSAAQATTPKSKGVASSKVKRSNSKSSLGSSLTRGLGRSATFAQDGAKQSIEGRRMSLRGRGAASLTQSPRSYEVKRSSSGAVSPS
eukprot:a340230_8.p1 GENE.a340230_8~~a340230_8.p1  ORF type:complete len:514 (+),score=89.39 a340230_8:51-1544(+)